MSDIVERLNWIDSEQADEIVMAVVAEARAEIERLRTSVELGTQSLHCMAHEIKRLTALAQSNDDITWELTIKIERLQTVLEQAVDDFGEGHSVCEQTKQECIRALEPKP